MRAVTSAFFSTSVTPSIIIGTTTLKLISSPGFMSSELTVCATSTSMGVLAGIVSSAGWADVLTVVICDGWMIFVATVSGGEV
jgi:hypothetical protein